MYGRLSYVGILNHHQYSTEFQCYPTNLAFLYYFRLFVLLINFYDSCSLFKVVYLPLFTLFVVRGRKLKIVNKYKTHKALDILSKAYFKPIKP